MTTTGPRATDQRAEASRTSPAAAPPPPRRRFGAAPAFSTAVARWSVGLMRRWWRWLSSMRTALVLLFLVAVAAVPGSLLPQRNVSDNAVRDYYAAHPALAPVLERFGGFAVFASPWFSAFYLLLFVSLVGCLVPRLRSHLIAVLRVPPQAPRRLDRLPAHREDLVLAGDASAVAGRVRAVLRRRRFRTLVRAQPDGGFTVSAEKGYLKESGNLLFHVALLSVLVGVALGSQYGYYGNRVLVQGTDQGFCNTLQQFDEYRLGARVRPADLAPVCVTLTDFQVSYQDNGQPADFRAAVSYTVGGAAPVPAVVKVNEPLRLAGTRIYLLGHGYAPVLRYTDRYGHSQTAVAPFPRVEGPNLTSGGVVVFPDANVDPTAVGATPGARQQVAFNGIYVPTAGPDGSGLSVFPAERNPVLVLTAYRGDLGMNSGVPGSVYTLDPRQLRNGALKAVTAAPLRLRPGASATLDDGTTVQFLGTRPWIAAQVRRDPAQGVVLLGAVGLLAGLLASVTGRRRRIWFRIPAGGPVSAGALARHPYPGFDSEFDTIVKEIR